MERRKQRKKEQKTSFWVTLESGETILADPVKKEIEDWFNTNHTKKQILIYLIGLYRIMIKEAIPKNILGQFVLENFIKTPMFENEIKILFDFTEKNPRKGILFVQKGEEKKIIHA